MKKQKAGVVIHYYDKIQVAVIKLAAKLKIDDKIKIVNRGNEFEQVVESLQINHQNVDEATKGSEVALKVVQPVKKGAELYILN